MGSGDCNHCGKHIADWPESWGVDVTLYCPECWRIMPIFGKGRRCCDV